MKKIELWLVRGWLMSSENIKKALIFGLFFLMILFCGCSQVCDKLMDSFNRLYPTFGLSCEESGVIQNGEVKFELSDVELLSQGKGIKHSKYNVIATNREIEFVIPFLSSVRDIPLLNIKYNGLRVDAELWYGEKVLMGDNNYNIGNAYSSNLDEGIQGTLYTIVPKTDTIKIGLQFDERKPFIFDTINNTSSTYSVDGNYTWTYTNARSCPQYRFFIVGEPSGYFFSSTCEYTTEVLNCKELISSGYEEYEEYYDDCGGVPEEFFYSIFNQVLQEKSKISYEELFFHSVDATRLNAYKFRLLLNTDGTISYDMPINVPQSRNNSLYLVEQKQTGYPMSYNIELNSNFQYKIESSVMAKKKGHIYIAETEEDFYFLFERLAI